MTKRPIDPERTTSNDAEAGAPSGRAKEGTSPDGSEDHGEPRPLTLRIARLSARDTLKYEDVADK